MKANTTYLLFIFLFITLSCSTPEEIDPIEEETPIDTPQLTLTYPLQDEEVHYCCFTLEWEDSENEGEYRVQLSKSSYTQNILFDTIVSETSLEFPTTLLPSEEYYWKVIPKNLDESQSGIFRIFDYIEKLNRSYVASINSYSWMLLEGSTDTTHQTNLKIFRGDNNMITYETDHTHFQPNLPFKEERHEDFVLFEIDHGYPLDSDYLKYFFDNDSIFIYSASGGNGGGGSTTIKAVYD